MDYEGVLVYTLEIEINLLECNPKYPKKIPRTSEKWSGRKEWI
jgi:hypothetical protein